MDILKIEGFTRELGKPVDWDDSKGMACASLPIIDTEANGHPVMISGWKPTAEELECLNNGAPIYLGVCGTVHPPVFLSVDSREQFKDEPEREVEGLNRYVDGAGDKQAWVAVNKIVVPTALDKVQLLLALKYIHDLRTIDTDYLAVNTLVHLYGFPERIEVEADVCDLPPAGWLCTREPGHDGPCAAWPL